MVIPWPPAQGTDLIGRLVVQSLAPALGQQIVVDNRAGAGGMIGTQFVTRATPDGYTLLAVGGGPIVINPLLRRAQYDPDRELAPIAMICNAAFVLVTRPGFPATNLAEFLALVRAAPERYTLASSGSGSTAHLIGAAFMHRAQLRAVHVPFTGAAAGLTAVAGGQVDFAMEALVGALPLLRGGSINALGISLKNRSVVVPDVPTIASQPGLENFDLGGWVGMFAPAGTPESAVSLIDSKLGEVMRGDLAGRIAALGVEPDYRDSAGFAQHIRADRATMAEAITAAGIQPD